MNALVFRNDPSYPLLYVADSDDSTEGWLSYLLPNLNPDAPDPPGSAITFMEAWNLQDSPGTYFGSRLRGAFIFSRNTPTIALSELYDNVKTYLLTQFDNHGPGWGAPGFFLLWLNDPDVAPTDDNCWFAKIKKEDDDDDVDPVTAVLHRLDRPVDIPFPHDTALEMSRFVNVFPVEDDNRLYFQALANNADIEYQLGGDPAPVTIDEQIFVNFTGRTRGCIQFDLGFDDSEGYAAYDLSLKYFANTIEGEDEVVETASANLFQPGKSAGEIRMVASMDPLDGYNDANTPLADTTGLRTYFAYTGTTRDGDTDSDTALWSYFSSVEGHDVVLSPVAELSDDVFQLPSARSALMVFSRMKSGDTSAGDYSLPQGAFRLSVPDYTPPTVKDVQEPSWLLCGLSGTEVFSFRAAETGFSGDILSFYPKQAAYVPELPIPQGDGSGYDNPLLTSDYETAYLTLSLGDAAAGGAVNQYFSQPEDASLFASDTGVNLYATDFLGLYSTPSTVLAGAGIANAFPMLPWRDSDFDEADDLETQILSPQRKRTVSEQGNSPRAIMKAFRITAAATAISKPTATPQGLIAQVAQDGSAEWTELLLAQITGDGGTETLKFTNLQETTQNAFQSNQLFMVGSLQAPFGNQNDTCPGDSEPCFQNYISLEGWPFRLSVGTENTYGDYRNVLIFKYRTGKLEDLVSQPQLWMGASDFNDNTANGIRALSVWLKEYIDTAKEQAESNPALDYFVKIATSDSWNGILALKVDIPLDTFPDELKGLIGGMDLSRFNAHHLGVEANRLESGTSVSVEPKSSVFGLINYTDPGYDSLSDKNDPIQPANGTYDFKVRYLRVLFSNSRIQEFASQVQVTLNEVFLDTVQQDTSDPNSVEYNTIILKGSLEEHNGQRVYSFTNLSDVNKLYLEDNLINYLEADQVQYATLSSDDDSGQVDSRFTFYGFLNFAQPEGDFDIFSFGSEKGNEASDSRKGLYFSGLVLDMTFNLDTPNVRVFTFDADDIAFDLKQSTARTGSLGQQYPLDIVGLVQSTEDEQPGDMGYLPMSLDSPDAPFAGIGKGNWFGIKFDMDLGGPGALASAAGFGSNLLLSWTPGGSGSSYTAQADMTLPGVNPNAKLLSIQGLIKLSVGDISMALASSSSGKGYMITIDDISLKLLIKKLPPNGSINFYLFSDPNGGGSKSSLGWYMAYNKNS